MKFIHNMYTSNIKEYHLNFIKKCKLSCSISNFNDYSACKINSIRISKDYNFRHKSFEIELCPIYSTS